MCVCVNTMVVVSCTVGQEDIFVVGGHAVALLDEAGDAFPQRSHTHAVGVGAVAAGCMAQLWGGGA
jgi:hypothetical protein